MTKRIHPRLTDARFAQEPVVTYSRVPPMASERGPRGVPSEADRMEPTFDAAEVPFVDLDDRFDTAFADRSSDLGSARPGFDAGVVDVPGRSGPARYVMIGSIVAILAGIGVLAASVGFATLAPLKTPAANAPAEETTLALTDPQSDVATTTTETVREIPLSAEEEATRAAPAAAPTVVAPPVPRPRPETESASLMPPGVESETSAADEPVIADTHRQGPAEPKSGGGGTGPTAAKSEAPRSPSGGGDQLITNIEEALAKVDSASTAGSTNALDASAPPVLPPPASSGPVATYPKAYPPLAETAPYGQSRFGPSYDILPPAPVTDNGYAVEEYPAGPVPPASVPYAYPPSPSVTYYVPPPSDDKPGIVKRTLSKTANAVSRVFSRD